jgi:hypothetical protein
MQNEAKPKYQLPEKNKKQIFLTVRIRELKEDEGLFKTDTTVKDSALKLQVFYVIG